MHEYCHFSKIVSIVAGLTESKEKFQCGRFQAQAVPKVVCSSAGSSLGGGYFVSLARLVLGRRRAPHFGAHGVRVALGVTGAEVAVDKD